MLEDYDSSLKKEDTISRLLAPWHEEGSSDEGEGGVSQQQRQHDVFLKVGVRGGGVRGQRGGRRGWGWGARAHAYVHGGGCVQKCGGAWVQAEGAGCRA